MGRIVLYISILAIYSCGLDSPAKINEAAFLDFARSELSKERMYYSDKKNKFIQRININGNISELVNDSISQSLLSLKNIELPSFYSLNKLNGCYSFDFTESNKEIKLMRFFFDDDRKTTIDKIELLLTTENWLYKSQKTLFFYLGDSLKINGYNKARFGDSTNYTITVSRVL